ncbi:CDP-glycerol glycerophosphotransferase family protein [Kineococcus rubinsiae]|uniref:CDP-glycerol glycerophosphotransferase family protein n=1 Tax=Kineococcus rubinsiae TaxID=2609562 RepID=UPI0014310E62|nr:CDP-glycerol glycerophosphotransferase family protein [Kineococcus rubinsiae]NIZ92907.1 CDP-glycerol glycerophosphotransferase family protein [Kineococcus rubinsiae]
MKITYHSFEGRYSDNPRALHEALVARGDDIDHVWLSTPAHAHGFPAGTTTVDIDSPDAVAALESADVVVSNTHLDLDWDKAPTTFYLQTWHGTPLKTIHHDVLFAPEGRLARLDHDIARWDHLLSPNAASTGPLRQAFRYAGPLSETGYPRNDVLSAPDRDERRAKARAALGVPEGVTAVLYTPTWRDDEKFGPGPDFSLRLDLERFHEQLGDDHVLLLRLHYMVSAALDTVDLPGVLDLSFHPDIAELYLAADLMVTDYSSTQFDFAVTGKPIVYFTYDLDHYRDDLRGFYFDFPEIAPGPLLTTSDEVIAAVADIATVTTTYADRYARFRETFCHREDGHATARVLALLPPTEVSP